LIVSRVGVGKIAVNETELCTSQDFTSLSLYFGNHVFFAYLLKMETNRLLEFNQGTSIKGFVKSDLEEMKVSIPCLEEQTQIANYLSAIDAKIQGVTAQIDKMEKWKKGLLQRMFV
jgi:type I restriction enzyme, S subunit